VRGVPRKARLRLPCSTKISTILSSPVKLESPGQRAWEQLTKIRVLYALHSGPAARPSAARSGNGARRGRRYVRPEAELRPTGMKQNRGRGGGYTPPEKRPPRVLIPLFSSLGRAYMKSNETRPLLLRKSPALAPSLDGESATSISTGPSSRIDRVMCNVHQ
jgi:hypothetical protein